MKNRVYLSKNNNAFIRTTFMTFKKLNGTTYM